MNKGVFSAATMVGRLKVTGRVHASLKLLERVRKLKQPVSYLL